MCRTSAPPRRELYEITQTLTAESQESAANGSEPTGSSFLPESGRRWNYLGPETHYGYAYHIWENELTKGRFAWEVTAYRTATKETA